MISRVVARALLARALLFTVGCSSSGDEPVDGVAHTPPIAIEDVRVGDYFCDMGTVEWSQSHEGTGRCPICGMKLVRKNTPDQQSRFPRAGQRHEHRH